MPTKKRKALASIPGPEVGDYMVEAPNGDVACFSGRKATQKAEDCSVKQAKKYGSSKVYRYMGWKHVWTAGKDV